MMPVDHLPAAAGDRVVQGIGWWFYCGGKRATVGWGVIVHGRR